MADIEKLLKTAKARETTVLVFLAGDVVAEIERLERQLADLGSSTWTPDSMADTNPSKDVARKIEAARKKLKDSEVEFRFRALPDKEWSDLLAQHPGTKEQMFDPLTLPRELIAACCVDPVMSPEQVDRLFGVLNQGQRNAVFDGAYAVNTEGTSIPFSVTASALLAGLGDGK